MGRLMLSGATVLVCMAAHPSNASSQPSPADSGRVLLNRATELRAWGTPEDRPEVLDLLRQAANLFSTAGNREGESLAFERLGRVHADAMALDSALIYSARALAIARTIGDRAVEARANELIGGIQQQVARNDSALVYFTNAAAIYQEAGNTAAAARVARRLQAAREARAVELLNSSPLLQPSMGVVAGARHVQETRNVLAGVPGAAADVESVEQADQALENLLSSRMVEATVQSVPPGRVVSYRRVLDTTAQEESITTDGVKTLRPALYVFIAAHPQTGQRVEQKVSCATNCTVRFNFQQSP